MKDSPYDKSTGLHKRKVSNCGKYEMGIYPVMFGFRIRAGIVDDGYCPVDYCGGDDLTLINLIYHCILAIIENRSANGEDPFKDLPVQSSKPMNNDFECLFKLIKISQTCPTDETTSISAEDLQSYKTKSFQEVGLI